MEASDSVKSKRSMLSWWSWKIKPEELKEQLDNYNTLGIWKSYKGISTLLILFSIGVTIIVSFFGILPAQDVIISLIIYIPIAFFVYRGHRWAMIAIMILWTLEKGIQLVQLGNVIPIIWYLAFMPYFYKAWKVEAERRKQQPVVSSSPVQGP